MDILLSLNSLDIFVKVMRINARGGGGGGLLPYMGYIGMCRCEWHGFQTIYSRIGYINQSVWV